jgi:hypothetical protein
MAVQFASAERLDIPLLLHSGEHVHLVIFHDTHYRLFANYLAWFRRSSGLLLIHFSALYAWRVVDVGGFTWFMTM